MSTITLASIVAIAKNNAIGKDNGMIWHLPEDLKHFKRTTLGKPIIMGRKSYESLGKALPGRPNIVISRSHDPLPEGKATKIFKDMEEVGENVKAGTSTHKVQTIDEGIALAKEIAEKTSHDEIFITGGGQIYTETLPYTQRLYVTILDREYDADVFFPAINWDEWNISHEEKHAADLEKDRPSFTFYTLERKA
jgi:dihydrofolate reductase